MCGPKRQGLVPQFGTRWSLGGSGRSLALPTILPTSLPRSEKKRNILRQRFAPVVKTSVWARSGALLWHTHPEWNAALLAPADDPHGVVARPLQLGDGQVGVDARPVREEVVVDLHRGCNRQGDDTSSPGDPTRRTRMHQAVTNHSPCTGPERRISLMMSCSVARR